jgi:argininosuccinate lyase
MMPQKKNPDVLELLRGKTGRVYGNLMALLTVLKGLPLSYNRDLQEDKEPLFDTMDTIQISLDLITSVIDGMTPRQERMERAAQAGYMWATDMADYLVRKGLPFRKAHEVVGKVVAACIAAGLDLHRMTLDQLKAFSPLFDDTIFQVTDLRAGVNSRTGIGGTAKEAVLRRIDTIEKR